MSTPTFMIAAAPAAYPFAAPAARARTPVVPVEIDGTTFFVAMGTVLAAAAAANNTASGAAALPSALEGGPSPAAFAPFVACPASPLATTNPVPQRDGRLLPAQLTPSPGWTAVQTALAAAWSRLSLARAALKQARGEEMSAWRRLLEVVDQRETARAGGSVAEAVAVDVLVGGDQQAYNAALERGEAARGDVRAAEGWLEVLGRVAREVEEASERGEGEWRVAEIAWRHGLLAVGHAEEVEEWDGEEEWEEEDGEEEWEEEEGREAEENHSAPPGPRSPNRWYNGEGWNEEDEWEEVLRSANKYRDR